MSTKTRLSNGDHGEGSEKTSKSRVKKPQKIFGVMSKRRWFGVSLFLCVLTWSYCFGPPLSEAYISNQFMQDTLGLDLSSWTLKGDSSLVGTLFMPPITHDTFFWQAGAHFNQLRGATWGKDHILFSDSQKNRIYSHSKYSGVQIQLNSSIIGDSGISSLAAPKNRFDIVYACLHNTKEIVQYNIINKSKKTVVSNNNELKGPKDIILSNDEKWLYFIDNNKIWRVDTNGNNLKSLYELKNPSGITLSDDNKLLYVNDWTNNEISVYVFDVNTGNDANILTLKHHWNITKNSNQGINNNNNNNNNIKGLALHSNTNSLITICSNDQICIIDTTNGNLKGILQIPADVNTIYDLVIGNKNLYITSDTSLWLIRIQPKSFKSEI